MSTRRKFFAKFAILSLIGLLGLLQQAQAQNRTVFYDAGGLELRWHLQAGLNAVSERDLFWNFAETFAPRAGFDSNADWLESYVKPGVSFENTWANGHVLYGKLSAVGSYTAGVDAFDGGNTGSIDLEEGFLGFKSNPTAPSGFDVSLGPRELRLGSGMLIANGGSSGFERGALKFGPRKAWEMAAIGSIFSGGLKATAFYIDPNEVPSNDGDNELIGTDLRRDSSEGGYLGLTFINVLHSNSPYVRAAPGGIGAPTILPGAREGTNALNLYGKTNPFTGHLEHWFFSGDFAYQWNNNIDLSAWAGRVQAGYTFDELGWSPAVTYSFQTFSGDDPNTGKLERFDPLYYEGSPGAWATGSKSSLVFINSNSQSHEVSLRLQPTPRDTLTLRYAHIRANELGSPVQFGQATRVEPFGGNANIVAGVTSAHLSDDVFLQYDRIINPNTFLAAGVSVSYPGEGIRGIVDGNAPNWVGGFINVVVNF